MGFSFIKVKMKTITKGRAKELLKRFLEDLKKSDFIHHSHWKFGPCFRDCAVIIRRGAEKLAGGHYIKLLPR